MQVQPIWEQQDGKCYFCQCDTHLRFVGQKKMRPHTATIEHLIPKIKGGTNNSANLKMSCFRCNSFRSDMDALRWLQIVNDPTKLRAFFMIRTLRKRLKRIRKREKQKQRVLNKYGVWYEDIHMLPEQFQQLFSI